MRTLVLLLALLAGQGTAIADYAPGYDAKVAASYVGKYILIGITYVDAKGTELRQEQIHGVIESVSEGGIRVKLKGANEGQYRSIPSDLRGIRKAKPGRYSLRGTREVIVDPDLVTTWRFTEGDPSK